ncbi:MAG: hypothetical protein LBF23_00030 [Endomicrobium sp.]|jgi:hypothetical protein|nr:hypothetical protein [Endomicrobium sp.]
MKKLICFFNVLCISVFCTTSVFAVETIQIVEAVAGGAVGLVTLGLAAKVAWEMFKKIIATYS